MVVKLICKRWEFEKSTRGGYVTWYKTTYQKGLGKEMEKKASKLFQNETECEVKEQTWGSGEKSDKKMKCIKALTESLLVCKVVTEWKMITSIKWFLNREMKEESWKF